MWISNTNQFVFVSTPKCGTHTMYEYLPKHFQGGLEKAGNHLNQPSKFHHNFIPDRCSDFYKFTITRNPYSRAVSAWRMFTNLAKPNNPYAIFFDRIGGRDFTNFTSHLIAVKNKTTKSKEPISCLSQTEWHNGISFDKYLRVEQLQEDFLTLPFAKQDMVLPHVFTFSKGEPYEVYYSDIDYENVNLAWGDDFKKLGYNRV